MVAGDPKPWHRPTTDTLVFRASQARVFVSLLPLIALMLAGSGVQYALNGALSPGMEWVLGGSVAFVLAAVLILPRINSLEFTPQHFVLRELFSCKQIAWDDIEPESIGYFVHRVYGIPLLTSIGFRLRSGSPNLTPLREMASSVSGLHVKFVNLYPLGRDETVETLRKYRSLYGAGSAPELSNADRE